MSDCVKIIYSVCFSFLSYSYFLGFFVPLFEIGQMRDRKCGSKRGDDMQQRAASQSKTWAAAARTLVFVHWSHALAVSYPAPQFIGFQLSSVAQRKKLYQALIHKKYLAGSINCWFWSFKWIC